MRHPAFAPTQIPSPEELAALRSALVKEVDEYTLSELEIAAAGHVKSHACPFSKRLFLLAEVVNFTATVVPYNVQNLGENIQLQIATYIYHFIDSQLSWDKQWGETYNSRELKKKFDGYIRDMDNYLPEDAVILDVGSGKHPLGAPLIEKKTNRHLVAIDIAAPKTSKEDQTLTIPLDVNLVIAEANVAVCTALRTAQQFTGRIPFNVDAIILGDILNYVDAKGVMGKLLSLINPGGWLAVSSHAGLCTTPTYIYGRTIDLAQLWPNGKIDGFDTVVCEVYKDPHAAGSNDAIAFFRKK